MADEVLVGPPLAVGDIRITPLSDGHLRFRPTHFFPSTEATDWEGDAARMLDGDGMLRLEMTSFLVRTGDTTVLIDCGMNFDDGGDWRGGRLADAFAAAGVSPAEVDVMLFTHLHVDHVGWATAPGGVPFFERAAYRCHGVDWEWSAEQQTDLHARALAPVADRFEPLSDGERVAPGVTVVATPGHTPGHVSVVIANRGERAFVLGDAMHCPLQMAHPEWVTWGDVDRKGAQRAREALMREIDGDDLVGSAHFPGLRFGRLAVGSGERVWVPLGS